MPSSDPQNPPPERGNVRELRPALAPSKAAGDRAAAAAEAEIIRDLAAADIEVARRRVADALGQFEITMAGPPPPDQWHYVTLGILATRARALVDSLERYDQLCLDAPLAP